MKLVFCRTETLSGLSCCAYGILLRHLCHPPSWSPVVHEFPPYFLWTPTLTNSNKIKKNMYCTITTTAIYKDTVTIQTNAHTCLAKIWTHAKSLQNFRFLWTGSYLRLNNFLFTMLFTNSERQFHAKVPTTYKTTNKQLLVRHQSSY